VAPLASTQQLSDALARSLPLGGVNEPVVLGTSVRGYQAQAGLYAAAFGSYSTAGDFAFAGGNFSAAADYGFVHGYFCSAGAYGVALGRSNHAGDFGFSAGRYNTATNNSIALGTRALALQQNSFVWSDGTGDSTNYFTTARGANTFNVRATGGIFLDGPTYLVDTNGTAYFMASTGGAVLARSYAKVSLAGATSFVAHAVAAHGMTNQADEAGLINLGNRLVSTQQLAAAVAPLASTQHLTNFMTKRVSGVVPVFSTNGGAYNFVGGSLQINGGPPMSQSSESAYPIRPFAAWSTKTYNPVIRTGVLEDNWSNLTWRLSFVAGWDSTNNLLILDEADDYAVLEQIGGGASNLWLGLSSVMVDHSNEAGSQGNLVEITVDGESQSLPFGTTNIIYVLTNPVDSIELSVGIMPTPGISNSPATRISRILPRYFNDPTLVGRIFETRGIDIHVDEPAGSSSATPKSWVLAAADEAKAAANAETANRTRTTHLNRHWLYWGPRWSMRETNDILTLYYGGYPAQQYLPGGAVIPRITSEYKGETSVVLAVSAPTAGVYQVNWTTNLLAWGTISTNDLIQYTLDEATTGLSFANPAPAAELLFFAVTAIESPGGTPSIRSLVPMVYGTNDLPYALQSWVEDYVLAHATTDSVANAWFRNDVVTNAVDEEARSDIADLQGAVSTNAQEIHVQLSPTGYIAAAQTAEDHFAGIDSAISVLNSTGVGGGTAAPFPSILVDEDWTWTNQIYAVGVDTSTTNIAINLPDAGTNFTSVLVRKFSNLNQVRIMRGTNVVYTLYDDGSTRAYDWWPQRTNWYWRN